MLIQDAVKEAQHNSRCYKEQFVIHDLLTDTFFWINGDGINPMLPLYNEIDCNMILSDKWEVMNYDDFELKHGDRCQKIQDEFFSKGWFSR